jgi:hypothetical protein
VRAALLLVSLLAIPLLAGCDRGEPVQRVELREGAAAHPVVMAQSPDTTNAVWQVAPGGQALTYGNPGGAVLLTLACDPAAVPPRLTVIRHAPALPGQTALFPVIGNGMRSRFPVDATLADDEWRWQLTLPADDPQWDVFTGSRQLFATLPGGGMLDIAGSRMPGAFVTWCRAGGQMVMPREQDLPPPDQTRAPPTRRQLAREAAENGG